MTKQMKYIHIRHLDYWGGVYDLGNWSSADVLAVEFNLSNDLAGEDVYFHFDFYTLPVLERALVEKELIEMDHRDDPHFLAKCEQLKRGELSHFIGFLYYQDYHPTTTECELGKGTLFDKKSPSRPPYYAVLFLREHQPLLPERLINWLERLSTELFAECFEFELADVPDREEVEKNLRLKS